jgi:hypothetical protein
VPLDAQFIDVGCLGGVQGGEGEVIDLLRYRSKSIYPDLAIIPTSVAAAPRVP